MSSSVAQAPTCWMTAGDAERKSPKLPAEHSVKMSQLGAEHEFVSLTTLLLTFWFTVQFPVDVQLP